MFLMWIPLSSIARALKKLSFENSLLKVTVTLQLDMS